MYLYMDCEYIQYGVFPHISCVGCVRMVTGVDPQQLVSELGGGGHRKWRLKLTDQKSKKTKSLRWKFWLTGFCSSRRDEFNGVLTVVFRHRSGSEKWSE